MGRSIQLSAKVGDFASCTVDNTALLGSISWSKVSAETNSLIGGSTWKVTGPDGYSVNVVDNGANDSDLELGKFAIPGLKWGDYTITEVTAPPGYILGDNPPTRTVTVTRDARDADAGAISNTAAASGLKIVKSSDPGSGAMVRPGDTITYKVSAKNTGNVALTPAKVSDDLSRVLARASYVEGSASASIAGVSNVAAPVVSGNTLTWENPLEPGQTAVLTYKVIVASDASASDELVNVVTATGNVPPGVKQPESNCVPATAAQTPECTTTHKVPVLSTPAGELPRTGGAVPIPLIAAGIGLVLLGGTAATVGAIRSRRQRV